MKKQYELVSFDVALNLLRPRAKWKIDHGNLEWLDSRPCPTMEDIENCLNKIKDLEESVDYVLLPEQEKFPVDPAQDPRGIAERFDEDIKGSTYTYGGGNEQGEGIGGKGGVNPNSL